MKPNNWDRIEEVFLAAADLSPEEQGRFLDWACNGDAAMRAEVESLLASDRKHGQGIASAVEGEAAALLDGQSIVGQRLGAYRALRQIGRGGM